MTGKQMYKELEKFANSHTLAKDIKCHFDEFHKSYEAVGDKSAKYDDLLLLSDIVKGAEQYLLWKRRSK